MKRLTAKDVRAIDSLVKGTELEKAFNYFEKEKIIATLEQRLEIISELYSDLVIDYEMLKFYLNKA